jgi:hypothetical protein
MHLSYVAPLDSQVYTQGTHASEDEDRAEEICTRGNHFQSVLAQDASQRYSTAGQIVYWSPNYNSFSYPRGFAPRSSNAFVIDFGIRNDLSRLALADS